MLVLLKEKCVNKVEAISRLREENNNWGDRIYNEGSNVKPCSSCLSYIPVPTIRIKYLCGFNLKKHTIPLLSRIIWMYFVNTQHHHLKLSCGGRFVDTVTDALTQIERRSILDSLCGCDGDQSDLLV